MRPPLALALTASLSLACGRALPAPKPALPSAPAPAPAPLSSVAAPAAPSWPDPIAAALGPHGPPHAQPLALPPDDPVCARRPCGRTGDAHGHARWLAFVGPPDAAAQGAFRVTQGDGAIELDPVRDWPIGVRVLGGLVNDGVAYVLLETVRVLDQPPGLRGVWVDAGSKPSRFDGSPLALAGVSDVQELASRLKEPPPATADALDRNALSLEATLRAASTSTGALVKALAAEGADVDLVWQSTFVQHVGHLDGQGAAPSQLADRLIAIVRAALDAEACGADACEAWTDAGHAVVRLAVQGGRWVIRSVAEDAAPARAPAGGSRHVVEASGDTSATRALLMTRAREVRQILGQAPLTAAGGVLGVALTDLADAPVVALGEGGATRVFPAPVPPARAIPGDPRWEAAFADVDGDGRTDLVLRMSAQRPDGSTLAWTQAILSPPPSVQATHLDADLASSLATMDAPDPRAAARAAAALPGRAVSREEACQLLATARTPAGFRRVALGDARVLLFDEPGMPTWRPRVVPAAKLAAYDVRDLGAHCAAMECSATRPYCAWSGGSDSQHLWFGWQGGQLAIAGAADYEGE